MQKYYSEHTNVLTLIVKKLEKINKETTRHFTAGFNQFQNTKIQNKMQTKVA